MRTGFTYHLNNFKNQTKHTIVSVTGHEAMMDSDPKRWRTSKDSPTAASDHSLKRVPRLWCDLGKPKWNSTSRAEEKE